MTEENSLDISKNRKDVGYKTAKYLAQIIIQVIIEVKLIVITFSSNK